MYWDNGEEITDDALLSFFTGSTTYDLMKEELCQLKHEMTQDSSTVPLADAGANDMLREELSQLQQPRVSQENINSITSTEEVCWIGGEEPTEEQIRFLVGTGSNDMLRNELSQLQQSQEHQEDMCYPIDNQRKEANKNLEGVSSSFDPAPVVKVVLDEIVDSVVGQLSNQASSLLSNETIARNNQCKVKETTSTTLPVPVPRFTGVNKSLHFGLKWSDEEVDRLTSSFNKKGLMSREDYNDLCSSIERIHGYLQKTAKSNNIKKYASGLEKLLNGGRITNDQAKAYKKQYNIG